MLISLHPAGHVLGANMVSIKTEGKTIIYTGDFCLHDTEILDGADLQGLPADPDILITESTYGGVVRPSRPKLIDALFSKIVEALERGGNVLIPTFAFHRTQEMARRIDLAMIDGLLPQCNAYYMSGLAHRITKYFNDYNKFLGKSVKEQQKPFEYRRVRRLRKIGDIREPAIAICTSGFGHAGVSRSLLVDWADGEDNSIVISSGYLPPDSPLNMAKEKKLIENNGESVPVKAKIEQVELSGHADQAELTEFVKTLKPRKTFLMHGELTQCQALSQEIDECTDVSIPMKHEVFEM
jgi:Cft2 family RNA processing exonuclease